ncbi:MAG: tripartite tricarboxylate transporter permease [Thiothrix sp.]|nr:tripartite tricarboxylate transporter permease [Thiothrix sp.]
MAHSEVLLASLEILTRWDVLLALLVGSVGGVIIGAIPGVGAAIAIAILLPATFSMEPITGLTLLLGIYASSMYGGAIPAILINTPGSSVNALTTYNGYPMTQRGEAARALALAYGASFVGGVLAIIALITLTPVLAKVAPMFGSREIFFAACLGMILVVVSHRGQTLIALAMLGLGIFLGNIGMDAVTYTQRYSFDQVWLSSGINLIVVVLGLYAISQAFTLLVGRDSKRPPEPAVGGMFRKLFEVFRYPKVLFPSSFFGVVAGIVPGVGEFLSQFFAYSWAQKVSKAPELFGKGAPDGIVASEAANNSVPPAAMIPLLALGIPGEELTAMMLTVFYVHNVVPGPGLFRDQPEFITSLYLSMLILNILVIIFLLYASRFMLKVVAIPDRFLGVIILTLSFIGVYSLRNSFTDCLLAGVFGIFGFILKRLDLPAVPIILGMVLGKIAETKFRSSMARVDSPLEMIERPITAVLFGLILLVLVVHFVGLRRGTPKLEQFDDELHEAEKKRRTDP